MYDMYAWIVRRGLAKYKTSSVRPRRKHPLDRLDAASENLWPTRRLRSNM
jgi:hypothetical protein